MSQNNFEEKVLEELSNIKITLERHEGYHDRNTASLEEHVKRTNLLEAQIEPIKTHVIMVNTAIKVVAFLLTAIGGFILGLDKLGILKKLF